MPKRIATISIVVVRPNDDGKNVRQTVEPGKPFNFTDDEIKQITAIHPTALRKPVNETAPASQEAADEEAPVTTATKTPKKSPKKAAAEADSTFKAATEGDDTPAEVAEDDDI